MDKIVECKGYFGVKYRKISENRTFEVNVAAISQEYNDFTYMMLMGSNGRVYYDSYKYLNEVLADAGNSKREQTLRALKLLYSYNELFYTDIGYLDINDRNRIIAFLQGAQGVGKHISYDFKTIRKNDTVNKYLGVYRSYYKYLGIKENIFEETSGTQQILDNGNAFNSKNTTLEVQTYSMNLKEIKANMVPKYIRYYEYKKIEEIIEDKYTLREKLIIKLMYEYGLRIGEVLGLTIEDIHGEEVTKKKGKYRLILRNRFTDKPYQHAKGCQTITSRNDYNSDTYYEEGGGYQVVPITSKTYNLIQEYIEEVTSPLSMSDKAFKNYSEKNLADKVSTINIDSNAYVFLSKNYSPITGGGWNTILKKILQEVGIKIDIGKKKNNLNHRFRHGFAMFKVLHESYDELKLAYVLRHSGTRSVKMYFNPTKEDLADFAIKQDELTKKGLNL